MRENTFTQGKLTGIKTGSRTRKQGNFLCCSGNPKVHDFGCCESNQLPRQPTVLGRSGKMGNAEIMTHIREQMRLGTKQESDAELDEQFS